MTEQEPLLAEEITCPYCNGTGGTWEFFIIKERYRGRISEAERGTFVKCRACRGLGKILNS